MTLPNQSEITAACAQSPGYEGSTAYDRTKICCQVLTERGEPIPSWMLIRDVIGKGSSTDINRGIKDFRKEHAVRLRQMSGIAPGIPQRLAPVVAALWEAAVAAAREEFDDKAARLEAQALQADARAEQAENDLFAAQNHVQRLESTIDSLGTEKRGLESQLETERGARAQAERMFESNAAEVNAQREKLEATLQETKLEMNRALERFDGERRYAMNQIEEARTKAATEVAAARSSAQRERTDFELATARLNNIIAELKAAAGAAEKRAADSKADADGLRVRLAAAEAVAERLRTTERPRPATPARRGVADALPRSNRLRGNKSRKSSP